MYRILVVTVCLCLPLLIAAEPATPLLWSERSFYHGIDEIPVYGRNEGSLTQADMTTARQRLKERPGGTAIIDSESLRNQRVSTLRDALGFAPGVFVQPRFGAEEARLSIRGSGLQRTFHMRGINLLQDGIPVNLADGSGDFQAIETLSSRYIEVYRGASALEYGAATLGGAINFVSPSGYDADPLLLRLEGGSFGYRRTQLAGGGVSGRADAYASITAYRQEGYRRHAEQENYRLFSNAGYRFSEALEGRIYLTHVDSRSELPGNLTRAQYDNDARQAAPGNLALDQRRDFTLTRLAARLAWVPAPEHHFSAAIHVSDKSLDHPIFQLLLIDTLDSGGTIDYRYDGTLGGYRQVWVAGLRFSHGATEDRRFVNAAGNRGAATARSDQTASNWVAFVENQWYLNEHLILVSGLQASRDQRESRDRFRAGGIDRSFDESYRSVNPRLGARYLLTEGTEFFASISRSYEPPSFGELAGGPGVTLVDAQRATSFELGARLERDVVSVDVALYHARLRKELLALTDGMGNPLGTVNADRTLHQGVELGLGWTPVVALALTANYLYNDFRFDDDAVFGDNDLAGVPPHQLRLEAKWQLGAALYLAFNAEWSPRRSYVDHANTVNADSYYIYGLRAGGELASRLSWFVDGRNLADRRYIATTAVVANAAGADGAYFLPGDGRAVYAGIEWRM